MRIRLKATEVTVMDITETCCSGKNRPQRLLVDGQEVGIVGLDRVLEAVMLANLYGTDNARRVALESLKASNYIPREAESAYVEAVLAESVRRYPRKADCPLETDAGQVR